MSDLKKNFEAVLNSDDREVPDHLGFSIEVTGALALAKDDPSPEHIEIARAALKAQIEGDHSLNKAIDEYLSVQ